MRFAVTVLLWLLATVTLAIAVPAAWTQTQIVDVDGYTAMAKKAATDPALQSAAAAELTSETMKLVRQSSEAVSSAQVHSAAAAYTAGPSFPTHFAETNRQLHDWLFTGADAQSGRLVVDLAPMLNDPAFDQLLLGRRAQLPSSVPVALTATPPEAVRPGYLHRLASRGPWVIGGLAVAAGGWALLTLVVARSRSRTLAALGVSGLLAGAAGWAAVALARSRINGALNHTTNDVRQIVDVMVGEAENSLHGWLEVTLVAGGVLVAIGALTAVLGSRRKPQRG